MASRITFGMWSLYCSTPCRFTPPHSRAAYISVPSSPRSIVNTRPGPKSQDRATLPSGSGTASGLRNRGGSRATRRCILLRCATDGARAVSIPVWGLTLRRDLLDEGMGQWPPVARAVTRLFQMFDRHVVRSSSHAQVDSVSITLCARITGWAIQCSIVPQARVRESLTAEAISVYGAGVHDCQHLRSDALPDVK